MNILIKNCPSLIGDFLGIAPALQKLAKNNNVYVDTSYEIDSLLELVSSRHNIFKQKNILLTNQGTSGWGVNPDAVKITKHIPTITAEDIIKHLN